jgi:hypothetical protein
MPIRYAGKSVLTEASMRKLRRSVGHRFDLDPDTNDKFARSFWDGAFVASFVTLQGVKE